MTANSVGRPSKAREREAEILSAMARVVVQDGIAGATFAKVAAEAGMQRTLVLHYFGSRSDLVNKFIDVTVSEIGAEILRRGVSGDLDDSVAELLSPEGYRSNEDLVVWAEIIALAARDADVRGRVRDLWEQQWFPGLETRLAAEFPTVSAEEIEAAAFALACQFEGHWKFQIQGVVDDRRLRQSTAAARRVIAHLRNLADESTN